MRKNIVMIEGKFVNLRAVEKEDLESLKVWRNDKKTRFLEIHNGEQVAQ